MKTPNRDAFPNTDRTVRTDVRHYCPGPLLTTILLACAILAGPGGGSNATAQTGQGCPPGSEPNGTLSPSDHGGAGYGTFPTSPNYDTTPSMGVFQINVDPAYWYLFNANAPTYVAYPGWDGSGHLTSPIVYDSATTILRSASQTVPVNFSPGITVGTSPMDTITSYPPSTPLDPFLKAAAGTTEVFTEISTFTLSAPGQVLTNYCGCNNPSQVPCPTANGPFNMVMAGKFNPNVTALGLPPLPGSYGLVQSQANGETGYAIAPGTATYDFPANSMFDIFVDVDLPQFTGYTGGSLVSEAKFPTQGLLLYSDPTLPLIVQDVPPDYNTTISGAQNLALCSFPPSVIYIHGASPISPTLYFAQDNKDGNGNYIWHQGDPFGSLTLGGHGTFAPCDPESTLIAATLGTPGNATQPMPIGYVFPPAGNTTFPPHSGLSYNSIQGVNLGGQVIDELSFDSNALYMAELSLSGLTNTVTLPSAGNSIAYSNANTTVTCQVSLDGSTFYNASGTGSVVLLLSNPNGVVNSATSYTMQITGFSATCFVSDLGFNVYLRQSPNSNSIGTHVVQSSTQGGPIIASFVNAQLQLSTDQVTWYDPSPYRSLYMELGGAPCGRAGAKLHVVNAPNGDVIISWADSHYTLEGSQSLSPTSWTDIPGTSPITNTAANRYTFYKLECH